MSALPYPESLGLRLACTHETSDVTGLALGFTL